MEVDDPIRGAMEVKKKGLVEGGGGCVAVSSCPYIWRGNDCGARADGMRNLSSFW